MQEVRSVDALSKTIDISRISSNFRIVSYTNYWMLIVCGWLVVGTIGQLLTTKGIVGFVVLASAIGIFGFSAWVGWKNIGVLGAVIHGYTRPAMLLLGFFSIFVALSTWLNTGVDNIDRQAISGMLVISLLAPLSLGSLLALTILSRSRIQGLDVNLRTLLYQRLGVRSGVPLHHLAPTNPRKGTLYGLFGVAWLLGLQLIPSRLVPEGLEQQLWRIAQMGYYFLITARQFFQPSFETVMTTDKRPPVVFLRSFIDDEKLSYNKADSALFDFSLESRLAAHFNFMGPFIAVGAPGDKEPHLGAVRASLSDDEWKGTVVDWMDRASLIVVMIGTTHWIAWELKKVVDLSLTEKLIVIFPQAKQQHFWKHDISGLERLSILAQVFSGTPWEAGLSEIRGTVRPERVRSLIFRENGRVLCVTSRPRNRESYHLAALISEQVQMQDRGGIAVAPPNTRSGRWWRTLAWLTASAIALFILLMIFGVYQARREMAFEPLPASIPVNNNGALRVGNLRFRGQQGGENPVNFKPGEEVRIVFDVQGYQLGSDGSPDVELKTVLLDPSGARTSKIDVLRFHEPIDSGNRINASFGWQLYASAAGGDYQVDVVLHDLVADSSLSFRPAFHLEQASSK